MSTSSKAVWGSGGRGGRRPPGSRSSTRPWPGSRSGPGPGCGPIYGGGEADAFARARPLFEAMGDPARVFHRGPEIHRRARAGDGDEAGEISAVRLYEDLAGVRLRLS